MDNQVTADPTPGIDHDTITFYGWAVRQSRFDTADLPRAGAEAGLSATSCRAAIAALRHRGLLRSTHDDALVATGPQEAAAALSREQAELERSAAELLVRQDRIEQAWTAVQAAVLPPPEAAGPAGAATSAGSAGQVAVLSDAAVARAAVGDRLLRAHREVAFSFPGGDPGAAALAALVLGELPHAAPGLRVRIIHQHPARFHPPTQQWAREALRTGAEVRTSGESCGPLLVIDGEAAVLPERGQPAGLVLVTQPALVAHLADSFETLWHQASDFRSGPAAARTVSDELRTTVLRLLADGLKDEVIARRLGISLRSCRRHIASLYSSLGADSRFQAGVLAERHGLTGHPAGEAVGWPAHFAPT
ncbi:helix-turn-helix transcriptional regulator [Kitasatospora viridis]|uniref:Regulatory LuxR family protein n=1 Tax=Kitasatospora viridis TaxID=281105 RepID=A0A561SFC4_9ACTN|nr:helix-turn-helix domain-containing protein [Kitasatospora viridis]TWF73575.1 regulatory LuxR family protein [Kitasatospora viridis]